MTIDTGILVAIGTVIAALVTAWNAVMKGRGDSLLNAAEVSVKLMGSMRVDMDVLKAENAKLREELEEVSLRLKALEALYTKQTGDLALVCAQLRNLGHKPMVEGGAA